MNAANDNIIMLICVIKNQAGQRLIHRRVLQNTSQPQPYNSTLVYTCPNNCNKISFVCTDIIGSDGKYWKFQLQSGSPESCAAASSCASTTTSTSTSTVSSTTSTISPHTTTSPITTTNAPSSTTTTSRITTATPNIHTTTHTDFSTSTKYSGSSTTTTYLTSTASTESTTTKVRKNISWNSNNRSSHMINAHGYAHLRTNGENITIIVLVSACVTLVIFAFLAEPQVALYKVFSENRSKSDR